MSKEAVETKVLPNTYINKPLFSIFDVDAEGEKTDPKGRPVVSFGIKKAQHVIAHLEELKEYVIENS